MFLRTLALIVSLIGVSSAKEWQCTTADSGTGSGTSCQVVTAPGGVFAVKGNESYIAISDNTLGPGLLYTSDYGVSSSFIGPYGSLNTDVAKDLDGNSIITTGGAIFLSQNNGPYAQYVNEKGVGPLSFCQCAEAFGAPGAQSLAYVGSIYPTGPTGDYVNGVAVSRDGGSNWIYSDINLPSTYTARYGAFPSDTTWFIAAGSWASTSTIAERVNNKMSFDLSSRIKLDNFGLEYKPFNASSVPGADLLFGGIARTSDGGKTWTKVFDAKGKYYFNSIHCATDDVCMTVAEDGMTAYILRTTNGGKSWDIVLQVTSRAGVTLMGMKMLSEKEAWAGGGTIEQGTVMGYYYHTTDGGDTWELIKVEKALAFDLSFADGYGYAATFTETGSGFAVYK